jgi:mRNA interferase RelE/StbE
LTSAAQREVLRLPPDAAARVRGPLRALAANPQPPGAIQLTGSRFWRVRVGDLRIVYVIDDEARVVRVDRVVRRAESTYRRLR